MSRGLGDVYKRQVPEGFEEETKEALKEVAATSDQTAEPLFK